MNGKKALVMASVAAWGLVLLWSDVLAWQTNIDGTTRFTDGVRLVKVDGAANVVATDSTENPGASLDFTVIKLRGEDGGDFCAV